MALQKSVKTPQGVDALYHRIGVLNIHPRSQTIQVVLDSYASAAAKEDGSAPFPLIAGHEVNLEYTPALADGGRAAVYAAIKALPEWADAESV